MKNEDINYRKPNNNIVLPIDTSARDFALKSELEKGLRELEKQQAMYQDIEEPHKHR